MTGKFGVGEERRAPAGGLGLRKGAESWDRQIFEDWSFSESEGVLHSKNEAETLDFEEEYRRSRGGFTASWKRMSGCRTMADPCGKKVSFDNR